MSGDKKRIKVYLLAAAVLVAAVIGMALAVRHHHSMRTALFALQEANQADTVFKSDSAALRLVRHFDSPACLLGTRNDRMLAHYLLGRAHADMDDAPAAIQDYYDAIECADATAKDCDFRILRNIYGQMAEVFHAQNLPEDEIEAQKLFIHYASLMNDTLQVVDGERRLEYAYYLLGDYSKILEIDRKAYTRLIDLGDTINAARTLIVPAYIHIKKEQYNLAKHELDMIRCKSGYFDSKGDLLPGREMIYCTYGLYYYSIGRIDSAEYYYRRCMETVTDEGVYDGLMSVYALEQNIDSIVKYAHLYANANDAMHHEMNSIAVHNTSALYNYNRHLIQAQQASDKAHYRLLLLYLCLIILLSVCLLCYVVYSRILRNKKQKEHALNIMHSLYMAKSKAYDELNTELTLQQGEHERLSNSVQELLEQKEHYEFVISQMQKQNMVGLYYADEVVQSFIDASIQRKNVPNNKSFKLLLNRFSDTFPHFMKTAKPIIQSSNVQLYVCILTDLGLSTSDIAYLMGQSSQYISNTKQRVNVKLFQDDSTSTLYKNLRISIHGNSWNV